MILAPIVRGRKGEFKKELEKLRTSGFTRARIDGELRSLDEEIKLDKRRNHTIEVVVDRLLMKPGIEERLEESVRTATKLTDGVVIVSVVDGEERLYSERMACINCGVTIPQLEPRSFSFNSAYGACKECHGLGTRIEIDPAKMVIEDRSRSARCASSAVRTRRPTLTCARPCWPSRAISAWAPKCLSRNCRERRGTPSSSAEGEDRVPLRRIRYKAEWQGATAFLLETMNRPIPRMNAGLESFISPTPAAPATARGCSPNPRRAGQRLSIADYTALPIVEALRAFAEVKLTPREADHRRADPERDPRPSELPTAVGLGYLTLDRSAATLSGGEGQRIRLATQIGSQLRGVLYVLDEPSIGLHPRDNERLLETLAQLRDLGNTVLVVEHDEETIRRADYVIDLGPGAGTHGGEVVAAGRPATSRARPNRSPDDTSRAS